MANKSEDIQAERRRSNRASLALVPLLLTVAAAVSVAFALCGGAGLWLLRSGRLADLVQPRPVQAAAQPKSPMSTHPVALEPLLVNLSDADGHAYLRVSLTLQVEDKPLGKGEKPSTAEASVPGKAANSFEAAERDAALTVIGRQTSTALLAPDGKERLKQQLAGELAERIPDVTVKEILFTEFLVQH